MITLFEIVGKDGDFIKVGKELLESGCRMHTRDGDPILFETDLKRTAARNIIVVEDDKFEKVGMDKTGSMKTGVGDCPNCHQQRSEIKLYGGIEAVYCDSCRYTDYTDKEKQLRSKLADDLGPAKILLKCENNGICQYEPINVKQPLIVKDK